MMPWVKSFFRGPAVRVTIAVFMIAEGITVAEHATPAIHQIGDGWLWGAAFIAGGVAMAATAVMRPGMVRAVAGAIPPTVQLARAWATWTIGNATFWGGGVGSRVSLALLMIRALGWSPDTAIRLRDSANESDARP